MKGKMKGKLDWQAGAYFESSLNFSGQKAGKACRQKGNMPLALLVL
ncbi:MAG: hypothetical protein HFG49_12615 [Lachnospiraceae bacterium]|jgi:hypothetical protein|nr:hypothetical protein [Lachnospiraceae bacterium]